MGLRIPAATVVVAAAAIAGAAGADSPAVPRFSLGTTKAQANDDVALRVERAPHLGRREIRLYLVPARAAAAVRTRFDPRLSFIGFVRSQPRSRLVSTVPPVQAGSYALAYWCRGCLRRGKRIGVQASARLRVAAPAGPGCPTTTPNGVRGAPDISDSEFHWHGNGGVWAFLRTDGRVITNPLGGYKMRWAGKVGLSGRISVRYSMLGPASAPLTARGGVLTPYATPNETISQMTFQPGCWQITGRVGDISLSFVAQVVLGPG